MQYLLINFVKSFLYINLASLVFYFVGGFFLSFIDTKNLKKSERLFFKLLIGFCISIGIYATITTSFSSLLMLSFPFLGYLFFSNLKHRSYKDIGKNLFNVEWKHFLVYSIYAFVALLFMINKLSSYPVVTLNYTVEGFDSTYYCGIADFMNQYGVETKILDVLSDSIPTIFYHYGDIWIISLLSSIFSETSIFTLYYLAGPICFALIAIGAFVVTEYVLDSGFSKVKKYKFVIAFVAGLLFLFISPLMTKLTVIESSIKLVLIYLSIIALFLLRKKTTTMIIVLMITGLFMGTALPAILAGVVLFSVFRLFYSREKIYFYYILIALATALSVILFYKLINWNTIFLDYGISQAIVDYYTTEFNLFPFFNKLLINVYKFIIVNNIIGILIILTAFFFWKNKHRIKSDYFYLMISILIVAFFGAGFITFLKDSNQLFVTFFNPLLKLFIFISILFLFVKFYNKITVKVAIVAFLLIHLYGARPYLNIKRNLTNEDIEVSTFYNEIKEELQNSNYKIGSVTNYKPDLKRFGDDYLYQKFIYYRAPLLMCRYFSNSYFPINISIADYPPNETIIEKEYSEKYILNSPYYKYTLQNGNSTETKISFLKDNKIDYLVVEKDSNFEELKNKLSIKRIISSHYIDYDFIILENN